MRTIWWTSVLGLALVGCNKDKDVGGDSGDSGTGDSGSDSGAGDSGDSGTDCVAAVTATSPTDGATGVYYRDIYVVDFSADASAAEIEILDDAGTPVSREITWSDGNVQASVRADLEASSAYTLHVELCGVTTEVGFSTSELGTPLDGGTSSVQGRTYMIQLSEADITEPALLGSLARQYLTVPLLFEVTEANDSVVDLLGALGYLEDDGTYTQMTWLPTWDFPAGDFADAPYFYAEAEYITIMYGPYPIPIENFTLEGSFTSDGAQIQKGRATGKADTRYMAPLIKRDPKDYAAFCDLAGSLGIYCEPCADGEDYCLYIVAEEIVGTWQEGVDLIEVAAD